MEWFRFYNETLWDRKLRRLPPAQRWVWLAILAIANDSHERGRLMVGTVPATAEDVRDAAAVEGSDFDQAWIYYQQQEMLLTGEGGVFFVANWNKRQFASDDAGGRKKAWQDSKKQSEGNENESLNGTGAERSENVPRNGRRTGQRAEGRKQRADTDANAYALAGRPDARAKDGSPAEGDTQAAACLPAGQGGEGEFPVSLRDWRAVPRGDLYPLVRVAFPAWNPYWDHKLQGAAEGNGGKPVTSPNRYLDGAIREHLPDMLAGNQPPVITAPAGQNEGGSGSDGRAGGAGSRGGSGAGRTGAAARSDAGGGFTRRGAAGVDGAAATGEGDQPGRRRSKYAQAGEVVADAYPAAASGTPGAAPPIAA